MIGNSGGFAIMSFIGAAVSLRDAGVSWLLDPESIIIRSSGIVSVVRIAFDTNLLLHVRDSRPMLLYH